MRIISLFCAVICTTILSAQPPLPGETPVDPKDYYPLKLNSSWTYEYPGGTFTMEIKKTEKIGEHLNAFRIDVLDKAGKVKFFEHVVVQDDGVYRVSVRGQEVKPGMKFIQMPIPEKGQSWETESEVSMKKIKGKFTYEGEVKVKVPMEVDKKGEVTAWKISSQTIDVSGQNVSMSYYFAKDIGMVQQDITVGVRKTEIKLKSFKIPQPPPKKPTPKKDDSKKKP